MSKNHHGGPGPVPPANRPQRGPSDPTGDEPVEETPHSGEAFQEQDPKRRLGDYGGTGEHPRQQPSRLNDGETHSK